MNAAGQLQNSAAELKRDIRTTTMGGVLRFLLCQYLFSVYGAVLSLKKWIFVFDTDQVQIYSDLIMQKDYTALSQFNNNNKLVSLPTLPTPMTVKAQGKYPVFLV
jgi:hypothetical protein